MLLHSRGKKLVFVIVCQLFQLEPQITSPQKFFSAKSPAFKAIHLPSVRSYTSCNYYLRQVERKICFWFCGPSRNCLQDSERRLWDVWRRVAINKWWSKRFNWVPPASGCGEKNNSQRSNKPPMVQGTWPNIIRNSMIFLKLYST